MVCEATGGYERHVLSEAVALGLAIHRAHGSRTRLFARFNGKVAKTDAIDARLIARYGQTPGLELYQPPSPEQAALRQLRRRRDELAQMLRMEANRSEHATLKRLQTSIERHQAWLKGELQAIEGEIEALIRRTPELQHKAGLMRSLKGVGRTPLPLSWPTYPRSDPSPKPPPQPLLGWPPSLTTPANSLVGGASLEDARTSDPASTWPPSSRANATPQSAPSPTTLRHVESQVSSFSLPSCASLSSSSTLSWLQENPHELDKVRR